MEPQISIIVPVYNTGQFIPKCIKSIINQTYRHLEIIIIDDGSTDNSLEICKNYADMDSRIILIHKDNEGVSSARNIGIEAATGKYISFVDSDDYISPIMYEKLLEAIEENHADVAECGYCTCDIEGRIIHVHEYKESIIEGNYQCSYEYLSSLNSWRGNINKLYKRTLFEDIRYPNLSYCEDHIVNVKVFYKCNRKVYINGFYYYYLQHSLSVCNRHFTEVNMDDIAANKYLYRFHQEKFSDLCPFIANRFINIIPNKYYNLQKSEINNKDYFNSELLKDFKQYYTITKGNIRNKIPILEFFILVP